MAKKSRHRSNSTRRVSVNANPTFFSRLPRRILLPAHVGVLSRISDNRKFTSRPLLRSYRRIDGRRVIPAAIIRDRPFRPATRLRPFPLLADLVSHSELPRDAVICARRRIRKSVLFAKGRAGRGGQRSPRFNSNSDIRCRR